MTLTEKIIFGAVVVAVSLAGSYFLFFREASLPSFGATSSVGNLLAEHYLPYVSTNLGYNTNLGIVDNGTFSLGSSGTVLTQANTGSCELQPYATTIAATSSVVVDCSLNGSGSTTNIGADTPLPGIANGGYSIGSLSTTTAGLVSGGLKLGGISASSTVAGHFDVIISNFTGTTYTWPLTGTASGTMKYIDFH